MITLKSITSSSTYLYRLFLFLAMVVFLVLSWKQPYSQRSLIGNFDPFPDSLHYVVPARSFVQGKGFALARESGSATIGVPLLYSLSLVPAYLINLDARSYYWSNLALGLVAIYLLFKIAKKLSNSPWITGMVLFFYVTNFVVYWQPSLAMAENLLLPILFAAIWFVLSPVNNKNILLATFFSVACYGAKYVSLPITVALIAIIAWRVWSEEKKKKLAWSRILYIFITAGVVFMLVNGSELLKYVKTIFGSRLISSIQPEKTTNWLSLSNISSSLPKYIKALLGWPIYNLWYERSILPYGLALIVIFWSIYAVWKLPKNRNLGIVILSSIVAQLAFFSVIFMVEGRYAFAFLPFIYAGMAAVGGWLVTMLNKKYTKKIVNIIQPIGVCLCCCVLLIVNSSYIKTQLLLNYKDGEMPWWQVGIIANDSYMVQRTDQSKDDIMISGLSPFVWDFYRQGNYSVLPFMTYQNMINDNVWGDGFDSTNLFAYYKTQIENGRNVFLSTVGFNNRDWPVLDEYKASGFGLNLVSEDCEGACKVYELGVKK